MNQEEAWRISYSMKMRPSQETIDWVTQHICRRLADEAQKVEEQAAEIRKNEAKGVTISKQAYPFELGKISGLREASRIIAEMKL